MADRSQLLQRAINFLIMPKVQAAPVADRIAFLKGKGFTDQEIEELLKKAEETIKERASKETPQVKATPSPAIRRTLLPDKKASEAVIAGGFAVCALASSGDKSAEEQMTEVLERLGKVLEASGSTKTNLVSLMVFVKDASTNAVAVNGVLDGWVDPKEAPTRAVVELGHRSSQGGLIELHAMARVA